MRIRNQIEVKSMDKVEIYSDGACKGNPGRGGWGALLVAGGKEKEIFGGEPNTTNNRTADRRTSCATTTIAAAAAVAAARCFGCSGGGPRSGVFDGNFDRPVDVDV